jgi:hypothetical protein
MAQGAPVISVDTKKKELVGDFKNGGQEWRPKGEPEQVRVHDFIDKDLGVPCLTLRENTAGWERLKLYYHVLAGVGRRDLSTTVLGQPISLPIGVAPTAFQKLACAAGEIATAIPRSPVLTAPWRRSRSNKEPASAR